MEITDPHDRFIKEVLSRLDVAEEFLFRFLPAHVSRHLQPKTFRLHKDSFVDPNLREYFSDLLYQADFEEGQPGFVYILFEHKSYPAGDVAFQLLRYMMRIWEYANKHSVGSVPPVVPVVLYHGLAKWRIPQNFAALYQTPESLRPGLLDFTYHLCDLSAYSDEEITLGAIGRVALLLMKHVHSPDLRERLTDLLRLLTAIDVRTALGFLETVLRYLSAAAEHVTVDDCRQAVEAAFHETGETFMDRWTEQLVAEHKDEWFREGAAVGLKQGIREGRQEGRQEQAASLAVRLLKRKFGSLDPAAEARIQHLSLEELERLGEELLDLPSEAALREWLDRVGTSH
ncbi:MAG: Rpn family recombination-promoting nuclease/putative transposase [Thermodesulfobacteriota bacterium]